MADRDTLNARPSHTLHHHADQIGFPNRRRPATLDSFRYGNKVLVVADRPATPGRQMFGKRSGFP